MEETKICSTCKRRKKIKCFYWRPDTNKYRGQCIKCNKGYKTNKKEYKEKVLKLFEKGKRKCLKCKRTLSVNSFCGDKHNTLLGLSTQCNYCRRAYQKSNRVRSKGYWLKREYGITQEDYDNLVKDQNNRCAICKGKEPGGVHKVWNIDHCHKSLKVRGLLCHNCNLGLGNFHDNIEVLKTAIKYLKKNKI